MKIEANKVQKNPIIVDIDNEELLKEQKKEIIKKMTGNKQWRLNEEGNWEEVTLSFPRTWKETCKATKKERDVMKALALIEEVLL